MTAPTLDAYWRDALSGVESVAADWHGGQFTALYALSSTGLGQASAETISFAAGELERAAMDAGDGDDVSDIDVVMAMESAQALQHLSELANAHPANVDADDWCDMVGRFDRESGRWRVA